MKIKEFAGILLIGIGVMVLLYYAVVLRFTNPDATSTRIFLTYWYWYLISVGCIMLGGVLVGLYTKRR